jgi:Secretion system C-terminal sorting domain
MKSKITLSFIFTLFILHSFSQSINWGNEVLVADGNIFGFTRPRIVITSGNVPVIMWGGGTGTQPLYAARWNGTGFDAPDTLTPVGVDPFIDTWAGADMAANGNDVFVVFKRQPDMTNYTYILKSTDGGMTWSDTIRVDGMIGPYTRFPSIAVSPTGNPAVIMMAFDSMWMNPTYVVTNSTDGGLTFPMPVNVSNVGSAEVCDCCSGYLEIDGNTQVAAWRRNNNNMRDMWTAVSTNSGTSFPNGFDVDNTNWMVSTCPSTGPDPYLWNDSLFTVFMSGASGPSRIIFNSSNITTQQSGYTAMITPNEPSNVTQNYPFIAGSGDTVGIVWQQNTAGNIDTYFSWSVTGSAGLFANIVMVNTPSSGQQKNPHIAYANGTFHITYTNLSTGDVIYKTATIILTGIEDATNTNQLKVYPNPSNGQIVIDLKPVANKAARVSLQDMSGRTIEIFTTNGESTITIPSQLPGMYLIEVLDENGNRYTSRVVFRGE